MYTGNRGPPHDDACPTVGRRSRPRIRNRRGDRRRRHGRAGARERAAGDLRARAQALSAVRPPRSALHQHGYRAALLGRAEGLVPADAHLGRAHPVLPAPRAPPAGAGRGASGGRGRAFAARHRRHRHQYDHRPRHPEPRGPAHEPPRFPSQRRAAADLRARLRRRRRGPLACDAHGAGAAGLERAVPYHRPVLAVPAHQRPEPHHVRCRSAVRRRSGRRGPAQPWRREPRIEWRHGYASAGPRSGRSASISGRRPSTSWAGTSRTTASASC